MTDRVPFTLRDIRAKRVNRTQIAKPRAFIRAGKPLANAMLRFGNDSTRFKDALMNLIFSRFLRRTFNQHYGFTRIELLVLMLVIAVLAVIVFPAMATPFTSSQRAQCFNNLRQIGSAVRQWSGDHSEDPPWLTSVSSGGTKPTSGLRAGAVWTEYSSMSNEMVSPRILACPSDALVRVASDWGTGPNGLANGGFRQQAVSYLIGLHANSVRPMELVAADFNISMSGPSSCSPASVNNAFSCSTFVPPNSGPSKWTNGPHLSAGHLLVVDGSVKFLDTAGLRTTLSAENASDNAGLHHVLPAH